MIYKESFMSSLPVLTPRHSNGNIITGINGNTMPSLRL